MYPGPAGIHSAGQLRWSSQVTEMTTSVGSTSEFVLATSCRHARTAAPMTAGSLYLPTGNRIGSVDSTGLPFHFHVGVTIRVFVFILVLPSIATYLRSI